MRFLKMPIYAKAVEVLKICYSLAGVLPKSETFNMTSQMNRAALSISLNIAEGAGRESDKEFARFISIAKGSVYEVFAIVEAIKEIYPSFSSEVNNIQGLLEDMDRELENFRVFLTRVRTK